jgi:hypothetical protein
MAIQLSKIEGYLNDIDFNFERRDDETILTAYSNDAGDRIMIAIKLVENGEFLQMRTVKHLDELVEQAKPEKRMELLTWMLHQNYRSKVGAWEYDPGDHDHHMYIGHAIEDGDLTQIQFMRLLKVLLNSLDSIPEMKKILGVGGADDETERKRRELLAQLAALDGKSGI